MGFVDNIFNRMDLRQVCTFLLEHLDNFSIEDDTYENRLRKITKTNDKIKGVNRGR